MSKILWILYIVIFLWIIYELFFQDKIPFFVRMVNFFLFASFLFCFAFSITVLLRFLTVAVIAAQIMTFTYIKYYRHISRKFWSLREYIGNNRHGDVYRRKKDSILEKISVFLTNITDNIKETTISKLSSRKRTLQRKKKSGGRHRR